MRNSWKMQECDRARACSVQIFNFSFLLFFMQKTAGPKPHVLLVCLIRFQNPFSSYFHVNEPSLTLLPHRFTVVVKEGCHCILVPENDVNIQFYDSYKKFGLLASKMFLAHQNQKGRIQYKSKVWDRSVG